MAAELLCLAKELPADCAHAMTTVAKAAATGVHAACSAVQERVSPLLAVAAAFVGATLSLSLLLERGRLQRSIREIHNDFLLLHCKVNMLLCRSS